MQDTVPTIHPEARINRIGQTLHTHHNALDLRYSKFIRFMRLFLPIVALAITAIVFTWGSMDTADLKPQPAGENLPAANVRNELLKPRFESQDEKSQPFTITADKAAQDSADKNLVRLDAPVADLLLESGNWIAVRAKNGLFRQNTRILDLNDNVEIFHDFGYRLEMPSLRVDIETGQASTDQPINGHGEGGTLSAAGLKADSKAGRLSFTGPVRLILHPDAIRKSARSKGEQSDE